jgi:hypothetical protein
MTRQAARDALFPLAIVGLLVVVAIGVTAASRAPAFHGVGMRRAGPVVTGAGVVLLLAGAVTVLTGLRFVLRVARRRRRGDDEHELVQGRPDTAWERLGAVLTIMVALGFAVGLTLAVRQVQFAPPSHARPGVSSTAAAVPTLTPSTRTTERHATPGEAVVGLAIGATVLVFAAGGYLAVRSRRRPDAEATLEPAQHRVTGDALRDSRMAFAIPADTRAAILACYRAMERGLVDAGTSRRVADTPEELLDRAVRSGLLLPASAQRLAALFREARFSTHPMTAAHRDDALAALGAVRQAVGRHQ